MKNPASDPVVSIVIVNWNANQLLQGCIRSIGLETRATTEIIVIDNASTDGSVEMVRDHFPHVLLIANKTNRGFAAANNQGILHARGKYVLLLNPDTIILDHAIDRMIDWMSTRPTVGCAGCQVWQSQTKIQKTCFRDPNPWNLLLVETGAQRLVPSWLEFLNPEYNGWTRDTQRDVDVVSGMFLLIPKSVISRVGVLDEAFFVYAEEADLCRRIRSSGLSCVFTPTARILHVDGGGQSTRQIKPRMHIQLQKSLILYNRKHHGKTGGVLASIIYLLTSALRFAIFSCCWQITGNKSFSARAKLASAAFAYHALGIVPK